MENILLVSSSEREKKFLKELLMGGSSRKIITAGNGREARRILIERDFDLCIIDTPLKDEFGSEFALNIAKKGVTQVILVIKNDLADEISAKVEEYGVFVIPKPLNKQFFWSAFKVITVAYHKIIALQNENLCLQKKLEDIKIIDRAKCVLIESLGITEPEAHRAIEKRAMNMRITKREVAVDILRTYGS